MQIDTSKLSELYKLVDELGQLLLKIEEQSGCKIEISRRQEFAGESVTDPKSGFICTFREWQPYDPEAPAEIREPYVKQLQEMTRRF